MLNRTADQERELVLKHGLNLGQAREIVREELFPVGSPSIPRLILSWRRSTVLDKSNPVLDR